MVDISGSYGKLKRWVNRKIAAIVLSSLADVDDTNKANDKILQYKTATEKHEYVDPPSGYTDPQAVAAVLADDAYLKNDADDVTTHALTVKGKLKVDDPGTLHAIGASLDAGNNWGSEISVQTSKSNPANRSIFMMLKSRGTVTSPTACLAEDKVGSLGFKGYDGNNTQLAGLVEAFVDGSVSAGHVPMRLSFVTGYANTSRWERLKIKNDGIIDVCNNPIKDMKNHVASALSGTKKLIEIRIGSTPYYFEVYPTKA